MSISSIIQLLKAVSLRKTLYFNLKAFAFRDAISFPVLVGKCVELKNIGNIVMDIHQGRLHLGTLQLFNTCNRMPLIWDNRGRISLRGGVVIQPGTCVHVYKNSSLIFNGHNFIGANCMIACHRQISFGHNSRVSWDCQICDTDFHFIKNLSDGKIRDNCAPIHIGSDVWICNHVVIAKGVSIADNTIIGQKSFVNKSISESDKILVGSPAKVLNGFYQRIWDSEEEAALSNQFSNKKTVGNENSVLFKI